MIVPLFDKELFEAVVARIDEHVKLHFSPEQAAHFGVHCIEMMAGMTNNEICHLEAFASVWAMARIMSNEGMAGPDSSIH